MIAAEFAALVDGREVGHNRFQAHCPAHDDRSPSMSIAEGSDGRVLLHCFGGCPTDSILAILNLSHRDLFAMPSSPVKVRAASMTAERAEAEARARRIRHGELCGVIHKLERIAEALGAKLARMQDQAPDLSATVRLFHHVQDHLHALDVQELEARP
jgi:hypothetical protein